MMIQPGKVAEFVEFVSRDGDMGSKSFVSYVTQVLISKRLVEVYNFSIEMERIVRELNGERCKSWDHGVVTKQLIFSTPSMGKRINDFDSLQQALCKHAAIAAKKAISQNSLCGYLLAFAVTPLLTMSLFLSE